MTSQQEGFPNSLSEAMAVGLPSVSFACHDGIVEMTENGMSGFTAAEGDREDFIEKMVLLAKDVSLRKEMGIKARCIVEKYDNETVLKQWQNCIDEAIRKA